MSTSISGLETHFKNQDNRLKLMISKQTADKSDSDKLFSISEGESEGTNRNNASLVRGWLNSNKRGRNKWHVKTLLRSFSLSAMITFWLRPRSENVSTVSTNGNKTTLKADSNGDTTFLGGGGLKLFDCDCPANDQGCDPTLGVNEYCTISGALAYTHPFTGIWYHLIIHQAVHMPELWHHLLCHIQFRENRFTINRCPLIYCNKPNQ